jgi:hypothetical protein
MPNAVSIKDVIDLDEGHLRWCPNESMQEKKGRIGTNSTA